jgi:hypothetical protein
MELSGDLEMAPSFGMNAGLIHCGGCGSLSPLQGSLNAVDHALFIADR